ncbi:MAG: hypothetical protein ACI9J3_003744 [Parvicellaceae bacterium]
MRFILIIAFFLISQFSFSQLEDSLSSIRCSGSDLRLALFPNEQFQFYSPITGVPTTDKLDKTYETRLLIDGGACYLESTSFIAENNRNIGVTNMKGDKIADFKYLDAYIANEQNIFLKDFKGWFKLNGPRLGDFRLGLDQYVGGVLGRRYVVLVGDYAVWFFDMKQDSLMESLPELNTDQLFTYHKKDEVGFANYRGRIFSKQMYEYLRINNDIIIGGLRGKEGLINLSGDSISEFKYDRIFYKANSDYLLYEINDSKGLISIEGNETVLPKYEEIYIGEELSRFQNGDNWGVVSNSGEEIVSVGTYDWISEYTNGLAAVKKGSKLGFINYEGKVQIDLIYDIEYGKFRNRFQEYGKAIVKTSEGCIVIDRTGEKLGDCNCRYKLGYCKFEE